MDRAATASVSESDSERAEDGEPEGPEERDGDGVVVRDGVASSVAGSRLGAGTGTPLRPLSSTSEARGPTLAASSAPGVSIWRDSHSMASVVVPPICLSLVAVVEAVLVVSFFRLLGVPPCRRFFRAIAWTYCVLLRDIAWVRGGELA